MRLTNPKRILIPTIFGISVVIIVANFLLTRKNNQTPDQIVTNDAKQGSENLEFDIDTPPETYPLSIPFKDTKEVIKNEKYLEGQPVGNPQIPSSQSIQFVQTGQYIIQYSQTSDSFLISIQSAPFDSNRKKAEEAFLESLDITKEDACKLDVSITTPQSVNPKEAGTIYRLSFCTSN